MDFRIALIPVAAALAVFATGCAATQLQNEPTFGSVVSYQPGITGAMAARVVMVDVDGQQQPLSNLYGNATVMVFLNEPCGSTEAEVQRPSAWIGYDTAVITVTSSPDACAAQKVCVPEYGRPLARVVSLCDAGNILRHIFSVGSEGGVLLLDETGFVVSHGTLPAVRLHADARAGRCGRGTDGRLHAADGRRGRERPAL